MIEDNCINETFLVERLLKIQLFFLFSIHCKLQRGLIMQANYTNILGRVFLQAGKAMCLF
jgi:hypothetical protein